MSGKRGDSAARHAGRGHECNLCGRVAFGNGGSVAHGRAHVRRGEAMELLQEYATYPPTSTRLFVDKGDEARIARLKSEGFHEVPA